MKEPMLLGKSLSHWLVKARRTQRAVLKLEAENPLPLPSLPCDPLGSGNDWAPISGSAHIDLVGRFASVAFGRCDSSGNLLKGQDDP